MNRGGFSWKRFVGISNVKRQISRKTGIPLTKSGRQQKIGRMVSKGCLGMIVTLVSFSLLGISLVSLF
ncbi:MAG TPA: hypothetical protein VFF21_03400 [Flavobacteriaceae bacterium]|nr:hypothetical protein [Flavobacteriaceae bacterium]